MNSGGRTISPTMVIAHRDAERYAERLRGEKPDLKIIACSDEEAPHHLPDADILLTIGRWLTPELAAKAEKLEWLQCLITGTDHLVAPLAARPDVLVTNARGSHGPQMAETAMMHLLTLSRGGRRLARQQSARDSTRFTPRTLDGRRMLIVGVGAIAEHFAPVCKAFGMHVVGSTDRTGTLDGFDELAPRKTLLEEAAKADAVVVFVPLTPDTRGLIGAPFFEAMKPDAYFINMARGGVVDEAALIAALRSGTIGGAALDVFSDWPLPQDSPLWDIETLLISPFIGGQSDRYVEAVTRIVTTNLDAFIKGDPDAMTNTISMQRTAVP